MTYKTDHFLTYKLAHSENYVLVAHPFLRLIRQYLTEYGVLSNIPAYYSIKGLVVSSPLYQPRQGQEPMQEIAMNQLRFDNEEPLA